MSRPIIATHIETGKDTRYDSVAEASKVLGISKSYITKVLRGEYTQTKGYSFKFVTL